MTLISPDSKWPLLYNKWTFRDKTRNYCSGVCTLTAQRAKLASIKFSFSKKATKLETLFPLIWCLLRKCQIKWKILWPLQNFRTLLEIFLCVANSCQPVIVTVNFSSGQWNLIKKTLPDIANTSNMFLTFSVKVDSSSQKITLTLVKIDSNTIFNLKDFRPF